MHILFLTDNYPPETNAPAIRTYENVTEWIKRGHKVTILTCAPNFPDGKVFNGYKNKLISIEKKNNLHIWRVKTYIAENKGTIKRIFDYLSFMLSSFIFGLFVRKVDIIIGTSPQFFTVVSAWALSVFKQKPFVFELRDIWPASISAVGAFKQNSILKIFEKLELFLYKKASLIISVTKSFKTNLIERGIPKDKIKIVFNGVRTDKYFPLKSNDKLLEKYDFKNKFVVGYIGTLGMAHALENFIYAAENLHNHKDIIFLLIGSGAEKNNLMKIREKKSLDNVIFIDRQPRDMMNNIWNICDISFIPLKDTPLFKEVIPSKIFESMSTGTPILISAPEGEATEIISKNNCGIIVKPENHKEVSSAILKLKDHNLKDKFHQNGILAASKYDRRNLSIKMLKYLEDLIHS